MPQIKNDGTQLTIAFDHEVFPLAGVAELDDTYVFLTRDGRVFEVVMEYLPLAGQTVTVSIFDVLATMTANGNPTKEPRFIPVIFAAAEAAANPEPQQPTTEVPKEESAAPEQEPQQEGTPVAPEPEEATPEAPAEEPQQEAPAEEPQAEQPEEAPEPEVVEEAVQAGPEEGPEPERIEDRVRRGEQVPLLDMLDEINRDKAKAQAQGKAAKGKKPRKDSQPTA